jgi:hypothetical protein
MWWKKKKDKTLTINANLPLEIENQLKESVKNVHLKIQRDLASISLKKRNQVEKKILLKLIDEIINRYKNETPKHALDILKKEIARKIDSYWEELEPNKKSRLI